MAEVYSSLFKGLVHVTTPYSKDHTALDLGNYKTRNPIYSPNKFGKGKVTKQTSSYTYKGITYTKVLTQWITYDSGFESCTVHGHIDDKILNVGDIVQVGQLVYRTGNMGYSKGDHLHFQLKLNGALVDPSQYVLNDENVSLFKIGDKVVFTDVQNIRKNSYIAPDNISGKTTVGQVGTIKDGVRVADGYNWFDIQFDGGGTGWIADVGKMEIYTPPVQPPVVPPETTECEKEVIRLQSEIDSLKVSTALLDSKLRESQEERKRLEGLLEAEKIEFKELEERYKDLEGEKNRFEEEKNEAVKLLNEYKNGRFVWIVDFLEKLFPKKK